MIHIDAYYCCVYVCVCVCAVCEFRICSACIVEESSVAARTFITFTKNINFANWMTVEEKCVHYVSPENKEWYAAKVH